MTDSASGPGDENRFVEDGAEENQPACEVPYRLAVDETGHRRPEYDSYGKHKGVDGQGLEREDGVSH